MKKLFILTILISRLTLGSSLELLEYRFAESKTMSPQKTMWGLFASEKENYLKILLQDTNNAFQKEEESIRKSIEGLQLVLRQSSFNNISINAPVLILFIMCPLLWPFLIVLWPLLFIGNSHNSSQRYSQEQTAQHLTQQLEKLYNFKQSRSTRYNNLIIQIQNELKAL